MPVLFVPRETKPGETRVAAVPETAARLIQRGFEVLVQSGAGAGAYFPDEAYAAAGAKLTPDAASAYARADVVAKYEAPAPAEIAAMRPGCWVVSFLSPQSSAETLAALAGRGVHAFAMDLIPRISRAQRMDALSSQANIAGYKAVLLAACTIGKYFPMLMTAAGTVRPARVLVFGAGVAGLQAIATARRLGAVVEATDIRASVKEQVESIGAHFVGVGAEQAEDRSGYAREASEDYRRRQAEVLARHVQDADVIITTAQVPGKRAPLLVSDAMLRAMRPGSVIVDLAAEQGGNVAHTRPGETVTVGGVRIIGAVRLAATMPQHASELYARNVLAVLEHLAPGGALQVNLDDEINAGAVAVHDGRVRWSAAPAPQGAAVS